MSPANQHAALLSALELNWQTEMEDHATYKALALKEPDSRRRYVLRGLAAAERHHALLWAEEISSLGGPKLIYQGTANGRAASFSGAGGIDSELHRLRVDERTEIERYSKQALVLLDAPTQTILREVIADENEHYKALSGLIRARPPLPNMDGTQARVALAALLAARKKLHPEPAGWLNDAIYAAHDGLGSIFGIVSGVAGATLGKSHYVLIAGLAGRLEVLCPQERVPTSPRRAKESFTTLACLENAKPSITTNPSRAKSWHSAYRFAVFQKMLLEDWRIF